MNVRVLPHAAGNHFRGSDERNLLDGILREGQAMTDAAPDDRQPAPLNARSAAAPYWLLLLLIVSLVGLRAASEYGLMREYGPDPQMPIWIGFASVKALVWLVSGVAIAGWLLRFWPRRVARIAGLVLLALWSVAIVHSRWQQDDARRALAAAADPHTSPERLRELAHFKGIQVGYELDNRLAANPSTPDDTLRELARRVDQLGTQVTLAQNPHTPADVRQQLQRLP